MSPRFGFLLVLFVYVITDFATSGSLHQLRVSPQTAPRFYLPGICWRFPSHVSAHAQNTAVGQCKHHPCVNAAASAVAAAAEEIKDQKHCRL